MIVLIKFGANFSCYQMQIYNKEWQNGYSFITSVRKTVGVTQEKYFIWQPPIITWRLPDNYTTAATYMEYLAVVR